MRVEHAECERVDGTSEDLGCLRPLADEVDEVEVGDAVTAIDQRQREAVERFTSRQSEEGFQKTGILRLRTQRGGERRRARM